VGLRQYFGTKKYGHKVGVITREELEAIREEMRQELKLELKEELKRELREELVLSEGNKTLQRSRSPRHISTKGSKKGSNAPEDIHDDDEFIGNSHCLLYVDNPYHFVAYGTVYNLGTTIHHKEIG
jgi:hypothetical protein